MGAKHITSIDDLGNEHARVLKAELPIQRDKLLRMMRWKFAMTRATLAASAEVLLPAFQGKNAYLLPDGYLSLVELADFYVGLDLSDYRNSDAADYTIEGPYLITAEGAPLNIRYVRQVTLVGE